MPLSNSASTYGAITKGFHWLTALLILTIIPVGLFANDLAHDISNPDITADEAMIARAKWLFSVHKTLGVTVFFVALARIMWALTQTKPGLLNGDRRAEAWAAETVHWLLYGSLVAVPLSGWVHHAATTGFAPIWWPFGQNLPFVPKSLSLADFTATLHYILQWVLIGAIGAHIAGALKHHVIDGDATLRRMLPGRTPGQPTQQQPGHVAPFVTAVAIWIGALGGAAMLGWFTQSQAPTTPQATLAQVTSDWQVQDGQLQILVKQLGSDVNGSFADWTADIRYDPSEGMGKQGEVTVIVSIGSLTLGSVTNQAMGKEFFNAEAFPTATFSADLLREGDGHIARGSLTIRDQAVPVEMPFELTLEGDTAQASGSLSVDRRDFDIGMGTQDAGTLGHDVQISFALTATRG
ncbi:hypothetical protein PEL8287_00679 [Roseovarius litorisediminis]|uniref:Lipid/polyisoprenoid-binding YceI-like domain-containing protein n=1 Tax=Roseovarius litorisediminis TaxID=1312363 RepID=A0A1Y5RIM7_9RHOB|nr:cytochrome b/b6 domain-containing protein [Roseovarius litorisediminis]SLN15747.1 hypothetical protein PEL8287_00679 [Roseovarius litorisediminis]